MARRVLVAMSGGVDSSVVAHLLAAEGHEVLGVTMRLGNHDTVEPDADKPTCCGLDGIRDARRVAAQLDIPYYAVNYEQLFAEKVVDYFADEYLNGRTPNPCVMCNQELKFGKLLELADDIGADYVATGHYARIDCTPDGHNPAHGPGLTLRRARDASKDQTYVLFSMTQSQLSRTLFPLGDMTKDEVRDVAREMGLITAEKAESQDICFIPDDDYRRFLRERLPGAVEPGVIADADGREVGRHSGAANYTVGQRRGLGIAAAAPVYVTEIQAGANVVVVGSSDKLLRSACDVERVNWVAGEPPMSPVEATVKIRYRDDGAPAKVFPAEHGTARVDFVEPRRAITPGQAAVFYDGDLVLGGGWIGP
ncbi:tRNA 2-thiouridine(34) synthase MnmA [Candidatus Poribacteria bacterium]|jgi:tRNA-uridine 2-sulfurtransferase|nr:tRNA 2-thiouridine(34) synthase MnmA [Candidatus Poribacteria bacterium]MBT5536040.1 tRNA 2-thiouridine(34) synthase MnmA [Candidatus Poribacteria bacterium]MBT5709402.1 tRNA 2-thiouridine(34) synthase MnmA [Candidatus Poribacteria bacterium]MBT7096245.1 tRNA 2-thiouridine(34) synthase MnmA [Candidatus Poribacteria bacterium]MBT7807982.1 tRNA 2-thiouridine(34) synthase MnmA [Candidatus Poribacteria bacterium]